MVDDMIFVPDRLYLQVLLQLPLVWTGHSMIVEGAQQPTGHKRPELHHVICGGLAQVQFIVQSHSSEVDLSLENLRLGNVRHHQPFSAGIIVIDVAGEGILEEGSHALKVSSSDPVRRLQPALVFTIEPIQGLQHRPRVRHHRAPQDRPHHGVLAFL